ncbi:MAG: hypothetical protein WCJ25_00860 [Candidatus Moraniibacteriota bacterium]
MPQAINIPEGRPLGAGNTPEAGPQAPGVASFERSVETSVEASKERAGEKFSEILSKVPASATPVTSTVAEVELDAKSVYNETDEEARVTKLLSLVETKGVEYAVKVAIHLNDYYVLDRMHDELASRFYEALVAKGVIRDE